VTTESEAAMAVVGQGDYRYELEEDWYHLPEGWSLAQTAIAVDRLDRVYLFNRGEHPMIVLDRNGQFVSAWGEGVLTSAHGLFLDQDDNLYLPVINSHCVYKCDLDGKSLMTLGDPGHTSDPDWSSVPMSALGDPLSGSHGTYGPFTLPTDAAVAPDGTLFVTDGYGNARVHHFAADGSLLASWGRPGKGEGEFVIPHGVWVHHDGRVLVVDRENNRIQIFSMDGTYLDQWTGFSSPCDVFVDSDDMVFVAEGASAAFSRNVPDPSVFIRIMTMDGEVVSSWGAPRGEGAHNVWADSEGSLYVNQNLDGDRLLKYRRVG
jgi:DNA-binding beta-propeller fold protein YncE